MTAPEQTRTVLVIGATGRTGRHVVAGLLERDVDVRALVRHRLIANLPDQVTTVQGTLEDSATLTEAARGADAAFLLWPMAEVDPATVVSALASQVQHVVYLSAAGDLARTDGDAEAMAGIYAQVEQAIMDSGVTWTFVRAGGFAANTLEWAEQVRAGDTVRTPYPDAGRSLIHERDIADVAVEALLDPDLAGRAVAITGPETLTQREQVAAIGAALGRGLHVESQPIEEARAVYAEMMGEDFAEQALTYWGTLVDAPELVRDGVRKVAGHPPRSFAEWARDHTGDFVRLSTAQVAQGYADALGRGDMDAASRLLHPDVVRMAPLEEGGREVAVQGFAAIAENAARQSADVELERVEVSEPLVSEHQFAVRFTFTERVLATGELRTTTKLSLCTVKHSRIVREEVFYYQGGPTGLG